MVRVALAVALFLNNSFFFSFCLSSERIVNEKEKNKEFCLLT